MSSEDGSGAGPQSRPDTDRDASRREALIKLGKYTAYATPVVVASVSVASAAPISGSPPSPTPPPSPGPTPPPPPPPA